MQENKISQTPEQIIAQGRLYGKEFTKMNITSKFELMERDKQEIENYKTLGKRNDPEKNLQELKKYFEEERASYIDYLLMIDRAEFGKNNACDKYVYFREISKDEAAAATGVPANHPDFDGIMYEATLRNEAKKAPPINTIHNRNIARQRTA